MLFKANIKSSSFLESIFWILAALIVNVVGYTLLMWWGFNGLAIYKGWPQIDLVMATRFAVVLFLIATLVDRSSSK